MHWLKYCSIFQIFDGADDGGFMLGSYCGDTAPTKFRSSFRFLYVQFTTDDTGQDKGFKLQFSQAHCKL